MLRGDHEHTQREKFMDDLYYLPINKVDAHLIYNLTTDKLEGPGVFSVGVLERLGYLQKASFALIDEAEELTSDLH
jgi:hypothetical protein